MIVIPSAIDKNKSESTKIKVSLIDSKYYDYIKVNLKINLQAGLLKLKYLSVVILIKNNKLPKFGCKTLLNMIRIM